MKLFLHALIVVYEHCQVRLRLILDPDCSNEVFVRLLYLTFADVLLPMERVRFRISQHSKTRIPILSQKSRVHLDVEHVRLIVGKHFDKLGYLQVFEVIVVFINQRVKGIPC